MTTATNERHVDERVSENINTLLFRVGITASVLARAMGMTGATLSRKMRGLSGWGLAEVLAMSAWFGVTLEEMTTALPTREEWEGREVPALCACRDSNPKPSDLYSICRCGRRPNLRTTSAVVVDMSAYRQAVAS